MCGRQIIFHLLVWLFYLLYFNITSLTIQKITLELSFITYFLQNGILFLLWEIVVQPKPDQPDQFLCPWPYNKWIAIQKITVLFVKIGGQIFVKINVPWIHQISKVFHQQGIMVCKYIIAFTVWWILINLSCAYTIHFTCDL